MQKFLLFNRFGDVLGPVYPRTSEQKFHLKNFLFSRFIVALQGQAFFVFGGKPVLSWLNSPSLNFFIARNTLIIDRFVRGSNERMYTTAYSLPPHPVWILSTFLMLSHTIFSFTHHAAGTFTDFPFLKNIKLFFTLGLLHVFFSLHVILYLQLFAPSPLSGPSSNVPLSVRSLLAFYQKLPLQDSWYHNFAYIAPRIFLQSVIILSVCVFTLSFAVSSHWISSSLKTPCQSCVLQCPR